MALSEVSVVDKIEVLLAGQIQVRTRNQVLRDGEEIAATYHRHVVNPGDDVTNEDPRVAAIAAATWSEEVVAAYQASLPPAPVVEPAPETEA
jgi:urease accessory protein UreE